MEERRKLDKIQDMMTQSVLMGATVAKNTALQTSYVGKKNESMKRLSRSSKSHTSNPKPKPSTICLQGLTYQPDACGVT